MAVVNYAAKYSSLVDERFTRASITQAAVNNNYDWDGVRTVNIYSMGTAPLNNYNMTGLARYGAPEELSDSIQTMMLNDDKAFTYTIDRRNYEDTMMIREVGKSTRRQLDEVLIPHVDKYRLARMIAGAGTTAPAATITVNNAYSLFLAGQTALGNANVPAAGRIAFVRYSYFNMLKQDTSFIKSGDLSQEMLLNGQLGSVDGVAIIPIPDSYFPSTQQFVITHPIATVAPVKIDELKVHTEPQGLSGWLVEGRMYHDAFVLNNKRMAIYVQ